MKLVFDGDTNAHSHIACFSEHVKKTEDWLEEIMELLDWTDQKQACMALRTVLHTLRDRLSVEEATDLAAQLPMLIRGLFFEDWNPSKKPTRIRHSRDFVAIVNENFPLDEIEDS